MKKGRGWLLAYPVTVLAVLATVLCGSRIVTVFAENQPLPRRRCIIIDAGHGGVDGGAVSCKGLPESGYNLEIALCLEDLLHFLGFETRMIRREDISVYTKGETIAQKKISDLKERVRMVNETPGALLLSIHQNYFSDSRYSGAQVFYPDTEGSKALATALQTALRATLDPANHRQARKSSGVYLMEQIRCTAVLLECGFLSNPEEEAKLRSKEYRQKLCGAIAVTIGSFLSNT